MKFFAERDAEETTVKHEESDDRENVGKKTKNTNACRLLELLLGAELVGVTALSLAAVGGTGWEASVAPKVSLLVIRHSSSFWSPVTYFRQIIFSQLYLEARALREGSIRPPRRRRTKCRVDSC